MTYDGSRRSRTHYQARIGTKGGFCGFVGSVIEMEEEIARRILKAYPTHEPKRHQIAITET